MIIDLLQCIFDLFEIYLAILVVLAIPLGAYIKTS